MKIFNKAASEFFEISFREKLQRFRDRHDAEVKKINSAHPTHRLGLHLSELKLFRKEFIKARVEAYIETCQKIGPVPDRSDYQEFSEELLGLAKGGTGEISRVYRDPLGPVQVQTEEHILEILEIELGQLVSPALNPLCLYMAEGQLALEENSTAITQAERLYQRAKSLHQNTLPLDQENAKLVIELADDSIREFGNTNQEKKVELRRIKAIAEEVLPPKTIEELRKRAEGIALEKAYPKNRTIRNVLYGLIIVGILVTTVLTLKWSLTRQSPNDPASATPASPSPKAMSTPLTQEDQGAVTGSALKNESRNVWNYKGITITLTGGTIDENRILITLKLVSPDDRFVRISSFFGNSDMSSGAVIDDNGNKYSAGPRCIIVRDQLMGHFAQVSLKASIPEHVKILFCKYEGSTHVKELPIRISDSQSLEAATYRIAFRDVALTFAAESPLQFARYCSP